MAALAANRQVDRMVDDDIRQLPVQAAKHIYKGAFLSVETDGMVQPVVAASAEPFAGIAYEEKDNSAGADADLSVRMYTKGDFPLPFATSALTDLGKPIYATDDQTLTLTAGVTNVLIGYVVGYIDAATTLVRIKAFDGVAV